MAKFVDEIAAGQTQSEAYRSAYDAENSSPATVWKEASRLAKNPRVAPWLEWLDTIAQDTAEVTRTGHLFELMRIRDKAVEKGQYGVAVSAEKARGQVAGLYNKHATITHNFSLADIPRTAGKLPRQMIDVTPEEVE